VNLADSDDDAIQTVEGAAVEEDEYFLADAGDFSHMYEVTGIDRDTSSATASEYESGDEATIDLTDAVTGDTVEVELDIEDENDHDLSSVDGELVYEGSEVIDGQKYFFELEATNDAHNQGSFKQVDATGDATLQVAWGDNAGEDNSGNTDGFTVGDHTSVSPALDTESDAAVAFFKDVRTSATNLDATTVDDFTSSDVAQTGLVEDGNGGEAATFTLDLSEVSGGDSYDPAIQFDGTQEGSTTFTTTVTLDDSDGSVTVSDDSGTSTNFAASRTDEDEVQITLTAGTGASVTDAQVVQAGSTGTVTASSADGSEITTSDWSDLEVTYTEGSTVNLGGYELPSTESSDMITGQSSQPVTFQNAGDTDATFTLGGLDYEIDTDGDLRPANLNSNGNNPNYVASALILPEDDNDNEQAYVFEHGYDSGDEELTSKNLAQAPQSALDSQTSLESDDDVSAGYDFFGAYHEVDSDEQGSIMLQVPDGQSVAGAAITEADGSLSTGGGSGSVEAASQTYSYADGLLTDDGNVGQARENENLVLVGGPAANCLTQDLVDQNMTMPAEDYTQGQGMVQLTDGFPGGHALVVAGATGEDTRAAAEFLADYRNNGDALEGQSQVTIETQSGTVVE
jgi:hypothetical protein